MQQHAMEVRRMQATIKVFFIVIILVKLWLVAAIPLAAIGGSVHDDEHFLTQAISLVKGEWLGAYNQLTLIKGVGYPAWIAANFYTGIPITLSQALLYMLAGLVLLMALQTYVKQPRLVWGLLLWYALYVFNPIMDVLQVQLTRQNLYVPLLVLIMAAIIGLYGTRRQGIWQQTAWSVVLGLALSWFWLTREESVWILPLVVPCLAYLSWMAYRDTGMGWVFMHRNLVLALPFVLLGGILQGVAWLNFSYYQIPAAVELKWQPFLAAYGALTRVEQTSRVPYVPMSKEVREQVYLVSPAFAELKPFLEQASFWRGHGLKPCRNYYYRFHEKYPICGDEIYGGWFLWAFRDAVALAGHYKTGASVENYNLTLAQEINTACDTGVLKCLPARATLLPVLTVEDMSRITKSLLKNIRNLLFPDFNEIFNKSKDLRSVGTETQLTQFHEYTHARQASLPQTVTVAGWVIDTRQGRTLSLRLVHQEGRYQSDLEQVASADVHDHFAPLLAELTPAQLDSFKQARFNFDTDFMADYLLQIRAADDVLETVPLAGLAVGTRHLDTGLALNIDAIHWVRPPPPRGAYAGVEDFKHQVLRHIVVFYHYWFTPLVLAGLAAYAAGLWRAFKRRAPSFLLVFNTGLLLAIWAKLLIIAIIDATSFPGLAYLRDLYAPLLVFIGLAVVDFGVRHEER